MQDVKMKDQVASHENAGRENAQHENAGEENEGHENAAQMQHNTTHRQFTRKLKFNDRQEHRNSNNILITNLPMIQ